eukprot:TRINITY_DN12443_c0_g1_i1.p1 TRINITY_DN12443_c0_g1~~TRINITY_DN12443_c0_g1_i1.p1  ORF type:complete len:625 (-),score=93.15 TRINITY_DN12443_c0_g1_i1:66-1826(-)
MQNFLQSSLTLHDHAHRHHPPPPHNGKEKEASCTDASMRPCCFVCGHTGGRLYACMQCVWFGCVQHIEQHVMQSGHYLSFDVAHSAVYCWRCHDCVYDDVLEDVLQLSRGSKLIADQEWQPTQEQQKILDQHAAPNKPVATTLLGLRGLRNLGNTCYMNSVLQAFTHNPLLRNYFLSDQHNRSQCTRKACAACDFDYLFAEMFSGNNLPISPIKLLENMWANVTGLASYRQQDAHEFLISALGAIHAHTGTDRESLCECVVHKLYSGMLRSDLTCTRCGFTSATYEAFFDISLDVPKTSSLIGAPPPPSHTSQQPSHPNGTLRTSSYPSNNGTYVTTPDTSSIMDASHHPVRATTYPPYPSSSMGSYDALPPGTCTLQTCLERFTLAEQLGEHSMCGRCHTSQASSKQLSLHALPLVLCLHLKRFEHGAAATSPLKIDTLVLFTEYLDMEPYLSDSSVSGGSHKVDATYQLFAVVVHSGQMDNGHYISYVRERDNWFRCDDGVISLSSLVDVMKTKAYVLFYSKTHLAYTPSSSSPDMSSSPAGGSNGSSSRGVATRRHHPADEDEHSGGKHHHSASKVARLHQTY